MTPNEVKSLQGLAAANGGQITINPDTGLPEAGFLESILPMVAGAFLGPAGLGLSALQSGLLVGGVSALASKDLSKGLMAGLGAYGGSGLMGNIMGAGVPAGQTLGAAADFATPAEGMFGAVAPVQPAPVMDPTRLANLSSGYEGGLTNMATPSETLAGMPTPAPTVAAPSAANINAQSAARLARESTAPVAMPSVWDQTKAGLTAIADDPKAFLTKENMRYGLAAAAPFLSMTPAQSEPEKDSEQYKYTYSPGRVENPDEEYTGPYSGERTWFEPSYTRVMAEGGAVDNELVEYEYDPLTKTYKKKVTPVAQGAVKPTTVSSSRSSSYTPEMSEKTKQFLDWEEGTAEGWDHRNERMQEVGNLLGLGLGLIPGIGAAQTAYKLLSGQSLVPSMPNMKVLFGTPQAYLDYQQRSQYYPTAGMTPGSAAWSQAVNEQAASRMARQEGVGGGGGGGNYGGWNGTAADNSNRSDPSAVGSMADTAGDKAGGRIGDKKHHRTPMRQGLGAAVEKGRFLEGPGDGVSDSIPATINGTQPARLADGEFVVPARIVSELGNGSSKAGARKLYAMMDRIQNGRSKTTGKGRVAVDSKADKHLPA
jgi:hypothetical protein